MSERGRRTGTITRLTRRAKEMSQSFSLDKEGWRQVKMGDNLEDRKTGGEPKKGDGLKVRILAETGGGKRKRDTG